jgi:DNA-binding response OmpR family regulator
VDDDRDTAEMLVWLLPTEGHAVIGYYAGQDALDKACARCPDVILLEPCPMVAGKSLYDTSEYTTVARILGSLR